MSTGNPAGAATEEAFAETHPSPGGRRSDQPAVVGPVEGQRKHHQLSDIQQDSSAGNSHGCRTYSQLDALSSSTTTTINCGGTLQHVGGILRCRSASADPLSLASGGDCDEGGGTRHPSMESISRPTLRAYSAPHFLHAALFPPKSCAPAAGRRVPATGSNTSAGGSKRSCARGRAGGGEWADREALDVATVKAPCQHHLRGGYLHRYMGFEQEKVLCPPVDTFRALGGLGEFPRRRRRSSTAPAVGQPRGRLRMAPPTHVDAGGGFEPENAEPGRRGLLDSDCPLGVEDPSDQTSVEEERGSPYPLELFAEGSSVGPVSSSGGGGGGDGAAAAAARCSESSRRPRGAKRQKSWATGAHEKSRSSRKTKTCALPPGRNAGDSSAGAGTRRCGSAGGTSSSAYCSSSSKRPSVFLPYSLQRPVTQERKAFFYTSN